MRIKDSPESSQQSKYEKKKKKKSCRMGNRKGRGKFKGGDDDCEDGDDKKSLNLYSLHAINKSIKASWWAPQERNSCK